MFQQIHIKIEKTLIKIINEIAFIILCMRKQIHILILERKYLVGKMVRTHPVGTFTHNGQNIPSGRIHTR